ncbi:SPOR domain-containing protein [Arenibaculum pallidiluteum]|uniref:SPOR domain-containing protein n=1 Tax=Arenibaculum pallidiluteum TaxID=2812559 RepID=UPI001A956C33|nr:SPOR domain-containing protein [Arenibaculum pallidiluteum]
MQSTQTVQSAAPSTTQSAAPSATQSAALPPRPEAAAAGAPRPAPPAQTPAARGETGARGRYTVQVGTFTIPENAQRLAADLSRRGFEAYVVDWTHTDGGAWKAVRVGRAANEAEARGLASRLSAEANLRGDIIRLR